jgi:hypothetical protein
MDKSNDLSASSVMFYKQAKKQNRYAYEDLLCRILTVVTPQNAHFPANFIVSNLITNLLPLPTPAPAHTRSCCKY